MKSSNKAILTMAATHIGDIRDIPLRSLDTLRTADLLVFEEDRPARLALKSAGIHRDYWKLSEHRQEQTIEAVREALSNGQHVAYMSDQGCPNLADPGGTLLEIAYELGATVTVIPGPSSITAALTACPFSVAQFRMTGFPPRKDPDRAQFFTQFEQSREALVIMDTPYRLSDVAKRLAEAELERRRILLASDISGENEVIWCGLPKALPAKVDELPPKRNFVIVVEGSQRTARARQR